jgi:hypothetical protein
MTFDAKLQNITEKYNISQISMLNDKVFNHSIKKSAAGIAA